MVSLSSRIKLKMGLAHSLNAYRCHCIQRSADYGADVLKALFEFRAICKDRSIEILEVNIACRSIQHNK